MKRLNYEATGNLVDDVSTLVYHCCYLLWTIQIREKLIKLACSSNLIDSCVVIQDIDGDMNRNRKREE